MISAAEVDALLNQAAQLVSVGRRAGGLNLVADALEGALVEGAHEDARVILQRTTAHHTDRRSIPLSAFLAILAITQPWRLELETERRQLVDRLRHRGRREGTNVSRFL